MAQFLNIPIRFEFVKAPVLWEVSQDAGRGQLSVSDPNAEVFTRLDGRKCLLAFLKLKRGDVAALVAFLNNVGAFDPDSSADFYGHHEVHIKLGRVWDFRDDLEAVMIRGKIQDSFLSQVAPALPPAKTLGNLFAPHPANEFPLRFELATTKSIAVRVVNSFHILLAEALCEISTGVRYKHCKLVDCKRRKIFPITNRHRHEYCSQECGHLASVRRNRREARKAKRKRG